MNDKDKYKPPKRAVIIHWGICFAMFCVALYMWGCAPKTVTITEYEEVKIPVKCGVEIPRKPEPVKNAVEMNLLILHYAEQLEAALRGCNGKL